MKFVDPHAVMNVDFFFNSVSGMDHITKVK